MKNILFCIFEIHYGIVDSKRRNVKKTVCQSGYVKSSHLKLQLFQP